MRLIDRIGRRLALSEEGVRHFLGAVGWTALQNITIMFPVMLVYLFVTALFGGTLAERLGLFAGLGILFLLVMWIVTLRQYSSTYSAVYSESSRMRIRLAEKLRKLPLAFFDRHNASDLTHRIMGDVNFLENAYSHQLPQFAASFLVLLLAAIGLAFLDWRLALALFWAVPVTLLVLWGSLKGQKRTFERASGVQLRVTEKMEEGLLQYRTIKAYGGEERYLEELQQELDALERSQLSTELSSGILVNGLRSLIQLTIPTLAIVGSGLYLQGEVSMDVLLFFLLISVSVYTPLTTLMTNALILLYASVRTDRMNEIYRMTPQEGERRFDPASFDIAFDHVSFAYEEGEQVLRDVSFTARRGEVTALIGPSGGGKSTCARLAARFWDPQQGRITLGGVPIASIDPETLLACYAIVFQEVVLFNNDVMENIRIGRKEATDEEVLEAARLAQCDDFVRRLPHGYHTPIGENGSHLSGGERQRISIARAILKDAPIIILDEATANQDADNETRIQQALSHLTADKTVLLIAHRMRTIRDADHIVVLEEGRVQQQGSPDDLYRAGGYYRTAADLQAVK